MKKLTFFASACLISMVVVVVVVVDSYVFSQIVLAKDTAKESTTMLNQFPSHNYDSIGNSEQPYQDSSILLPLSSEMASDISSSFSNIIDTQIFAGLDD